MSLIKIIGKCNRCGECCHTEKERCKYLTGNNLCSIYKYREKLGRGCGNFPILSDFEFKGIPKNCGFKLINMEKK